MGYGTRCRNRLGRHIFGPTVSSRYSVLVIGIEPYYTTPGLVGSHRGQGYRIWDGFSLRGSVLADRRAVLGVMFHV